MQDDRVTTWRVELKPRAAKTVAALGPDPPFNPTLAEVISELERDPKQFEKKAGKMQGMRAAALRYRNVPWRIPFTLDERARVVTILAIDRHDVAYRIASR